jgi:spore maturation protein CgeB
MPERGPILAHLIERGLPVRIFGPRWERAPEFSRLAPCTKVGGLDTAAYEAAVAAADISIALLSKGNSDLHTTRTMEIPSLGSLLCGERTEEHLALYQDGTEAIFWSDQEECFRLCRELLDRSDLRRTIAQAGRARAIANNHFNEPLMQGIISRVLNTNGPYLNKSVTA